MEINHSILLLDGGFSNELSKRCSYDVDKDPLWTAKALLTDTKAVMETHLEYLKAGADIIETASYQATPKGLHKFLGLSQEECETVIKNSVELANEAVVQFKSESKQGASRPVMIAGSIGPYGVFLSDGSEYTGSYMDKVSEQDIIALHSLRLEILGRHPKVDLLALETMPSMKEVEILLRLIKEKRIDKPVWVSFTLKEDDPTKTARGESVEDTFKTFVSNNENNIWAFGTNCVSPQNVEMFLKTVNKAKANMKSFGTRLIVYPNVGRSWISGVGWSDEEVPAIVNFTKEWLNLGCSVVGGCCQVGPDQIKLLRTMIENLR